MAKLTGGQAAVAALQNEKVSHVFGLIGSANWTPVWRDRRAISTFGNI